jgi:hypothetical protein
MPDTPPLVFKRDSGIGYKGARTPGVRGWATLPARLG